MYTVSVARISEYNVDEARSALVRSLNDIGYALPQNKTVLIKPNCMAQNRPEQHTVTHHTILGAIAGLLKDNNCTILIGESSAFFQSGLTRRAFDITQMSRVAAQYGARLVPFEEEKLERVDLSRNMHFRADFPVREIYIPRIVLDTDTMINVCKLKSHGSGFRLSGAIKNLYGLLPGGFKQKIHLLLKDDNDACDLIAEIHRIVPPGLNVMDAVYGLDGGPSAIGKRVPVGAILASENAAALDTVACRMIGYSPEEVPLLVRARALGLIRDFNEVRVQGDTPPSAVFKRLHRGPFPGLRKKDSIFIKDTFVYPRVRREGCSDCGECISFCPAGAVSRTGGGRYTIDYLQCVFCYYCFTACKAGAIGFKSTFMNKAIRFLWNVTGL